MSKLENNDLVNFIINSESTREEAAEYFGVSKSTVAKRLKIIKDELNKDSIIYKDLEKTLKKNETEGRLKGSYAHNIQIDDEELENIAHEAMEFITNNLTLRSASNEFDKSRSALYSRFEKLNCEKYQELYYDLKTLYEAHNKRIDNKLLERLQLKYSLKLDEQTKRK